MKPGLFATWRAFAMVVFLALAFAASFVAVVLGGAYFAVSVLRALFGGAP